MDALERERDDGRCGCRTRRGRYRDDRRDLFEGPPHCDQHGREEGERGRLIGQTKRDMNTKPHASCDNRGHHPLTGQRAGLQAAQTRQIRAGSLWVEDEACQTYSTAVVGFRGV